MKIIVFGGSGYVGRRLIEKLFTYNFENLRIISVDIKCYTKEQLFEKAKIHWKYSDPEKYQKYEKQSKPKDEITWLDNVELIEGDLTNKDFVDSILKQDIDAIFHLASFGMSGSDMLKKKKIQLINIKGTEILLESALNFNIPKFVYTSTYNVCFSGNQILDGDENTPYFPDEKHCDEYSRTKSIAEQIVLKYNGKKCKNGKELLTIAIRPAAIYGEGEERHLPRIVSYLEKGLLAFTIGDPTNQVDFIYIDNLISAHILAFSSLKNSQIPPCGKGYAISDDEPINNFEFFKKLWTGLGYPHPKINLPYSFAFHIAWGIEKIHEKLDGVWNFEPLLTRGEVNKIGVTHFFSMKSPKRDFGYVPEIKSDEGMRRVVDHFIFLGHKKKESYFNSLFLFSIIILILAIIYFL